MNTADLVRALDAVLSVLSGPDLLRTRLVRAWCLHLADLDLGLVPATHRARLIAFRERIGDIEHAPLTDEEATRWSAWLTELGVEYGGARDETQPVPPTRPTARSTSVPPHA